LTLEMNSGETVVAESGAMVAKASGLELEASTRGGILEAAKRKVLGGENFFVNKFTAQSPGRLDLAPAMPGDIVHIPLAGEMVLQKDAFLASADSVTIDIKWAGLKGFFSGEGFFLFLAKGVGDLFINSYGAIERIDVAGDYIVDTGHIVAFEPTLTYKVEKPGNWRTTIFSGEFLVCRFTGQGRLYIQSRAVRPFAHWIHPFRRVKPKSDARR